jgi:hypothetical protein
MRLESEEKGPVAYSAIVCKYVGMELEEQIECLGGERETQKSCV